MADFTRSKQKEHAEYPAATLLIGHPTQVNIQSIPGQGPEGHLVLKLENEVGPPLQIQKNYVNFNKNRHF